MSRSVVSTTVAILSPARWWASAATLVAILGARRFAQSWLQEVLAAIIVLLAWWLGADTAALVTNIF
jgi:hypothetical protein